MMLHGLLPNRRLGLSGGPAGAGELVNSLAAANQQVPKALMDVAAKDGRFRKAGNRSGSRGRGGRGRGRSQVGCVLHCGPNTLSS